MEAAISAYYQAIGKKDFETAYSIWTPSLQKSLTPNDLATQWSSLGADGAQANLSVSMSEPPDGDFVPTTVTETESYPGGYVRKKVLKGGWHVVNIGERWLLNERDFKTVADNGPPPTSPVNDGMGGSSQASNSSGSGDSGTPSSTSQVTSSEAGTDCPEQQHIKDFLGDTREESVPPPPPETGLGYFAQRVSQLSVAQQQIVYQRSVANHEEMNSAMGGVDMDILTVLANHCRLADLESTAGPTKNPILAWNRADYAPNAQDEDSAIKASVELAYGEMAAEIAVEARGLVSETVVDRLYIAFEPVIPLSTIPMKFREGSVTALSR
jgi:hypothetical protein